MRFTISLVAVSLLLSSNAFCGTGTQDEKSKEANLKSRTSLKLSASKRSIDENILPDDAEKKTLESSHEQVASIDVNLGFKKPSPLHGFCLDAAGNIVAAVGGTPPRSTRIRETRDPQLRKFSDSGELLDAWDVPFTPQAITCGPAGYIYIAGEGKIAKMTDKGDIVSTGATPNVADREKMAKQIREQLQQQMKIMRANYTKMIERHNKTIETLKAKLEDSDDLEDPDEKVSKKDQLQIKRLEKSVKSLEARLKNMREPTDAQIEFTIQQRLSISSISTTSKNIFVATRAENGSGYSVWKSDLDFKNPTRVVTGLRGCCGQMDVQAREDGIFVAENSRHRVVHYDVNGKEIGHWGEGKRTGDEGFGSCCNPMNVCFCDSNQVLTAESGTGRIKLYQPDGTLVGLIGNAKIKGGCKNVSISASSDLSRVYMLDLTAAKICVLKPKTSETRSDSTESDLERN